MVTLKLFVNVEGLCFITNALNDSFDMEWGQTTPAMLKGTRDFNLEIQVPIQAVSGFAKKNETKIQLYTLQQLNRNNNYRRSSI